MLASRTVFTLFSLLLLSTACGKAAESWGWRKVATLPEPIANNAVAAILTADGCTVYSALGIDQTRTAAGIHRRAVSWTVGDAAFVTLPDVPGAVGRVAASAVAVRGKLYVLGGYSVGGNGAEVSFANVDVFDPATSLWSSAAPMPIPIDDTIAVVWRDRWIIVVSGWSNTANVNDVQIYDADTDTWTAGTAFPGTGVFGGNGAIFEDELIVIDGVSSQPGFPLVTQAWRGTLDAANPQTIEWTELPAHPGPSRYRAAPAATDDGLLLFHGGTSEPYNFDGLTYGARTPATPLASTLVYNTKTREFSLSMPDKPTATMDHRALAECGSKLYSLGGMINGPVVTADAWVLERVTR